QKYGKLEMKAALYGIIRSFRMEAITKPADMRHKGDIKTINKFWKDVRDDYTKICAMCFKSSSFFNDIILFTYACNLLFILIQLFVSLRRREQVIELLYFFGSFVFVVTRTVMVSIYGGWLYESARAALPMLNAVPCDLYNEE
uniref:Gustatory receptor for sugar taste 61a-like n=1 Tax=Diabrotica virgifera virgifera TaxID=50390 RepID=A0A6P7H624_DIAVI